MDGHLNRIGRIGDVDECQTLPAGGNEGIIPRNLEVPGLLPTRRSISPDEPWICRIPDLQHQQSPVPSRRIGKSTCNRNVGERPIAGVGADLAWVGGIGNVVHAKPIFARCEEGVRPRQGNAKHDVEFKRGHRLRPGRIRQVDDPETFLLRHHISHVCRDYRLLHVLRRVEGTYLQGFFGCGVLQEAQTPATRR